MIETLREMEALDWDEAVSWARDWTDEELDVLCGSNDLHSGDLYVRIRGLQRGEKSLR